MNSSGTQNPLSRATRREFLKTSTKAVAGVALAAAVARPGYAAGSDQINVALIGCGGRGTGAAEDALSTSKLGPIKLVAMADVFESRLKSSYNQFSKAPASEVDVPPERRFVGFDAYKKAMDCLKPGDIAIFATPPGFRWVHFEYAIQKGLNVFMEKPITVDGPSTRRMLKLAEESKKKNLKVGVGLMSRHSRDLQELAKRIHDGEIGDLILERGYRVHGPVGSFASPPRPPGISEVMYQIQRFHSFLWASGGNYSDFYIHVIDHLCWMKNAWPVKAMGLGGRHYRTSPDGSVTYVDQNFDVYAIEYTFADGSSMMFDGRCMTGCSEVYSSYAHGSKGMAVVSKNGDCGRPSSIYKGQNPERSNLVWESKAVSGELNPYKNEWMDLVTAIRNDQPYHELQRGAEASLVTSMGRMAAHTGQVITYEQILNSSHEFAPEVANLTADGPAPLKLDAKGRYPVPQPGIVTDREY
ncbi:MAG TPA: Gfo/Idh/MocA family oxidoreductase [Candidatus Paceibacterota bacterium]|nr:Gfo/Idh/MocA family oxidoreductase [Verrucomicrobiota bacterium]HRY51661.1 Gfo/Idh/MocA family oxidoreductase [Candidatus Paceibacterota bacterium]